MTLKYSQLITRVPDTYDPEWFARMFDVIKAEMNGRIASIGNLTERVVHDGSAGEIELGSIAVYGDFDNLQTVTLKGEFFGQFAQNNNDKTIRLYLNSTVLGTIVATHQSVLFWDVMLTFFIFPAQTLQRGVIRWNTADESDVTVFERTETPPLILSITAEASPPVAGDVTFEGGTLSEEQTEFRP